MIEKLGTMGMESDAEGRKLGAPKHARTDYSMRALSSDAYLQEWVYQANRNDTEADVAFFIGGTHVSGTLIGYGEWERYNRSQITARNADIEENEQTVLRKSIDDLQEIAENLGYANTQPFAFAHLKNATIHGPMPAHLPYLRVRLEGVDAWNISN